MIGGALADAAGWRWIARTGRTALLAGGVALLAVFTVHVLRSGDVAPLLDLRLFRHRPFAAASALGFLSRVSIFGVMIMMPLYYQQVRGYGALTAGLLLAPQSLGTMLALPYAGRLTDRIGARPVVLTGIAVTALATLPLTRVGAHTSGVFLGAVLLVWGTGVAAVAVPSAAAAYDGLAASPVRRARSRPCRRSAPRPARPCSPRSCRAGRGDGPAAFAATFWWVLGFTALTLVPALLLPDRAEARPGR